MQAGIEDDDDGPADNIAMAIDMDELGEDIGTDDDLPHYTANAASSVDGDNGNQSGSERAVAVVTSTQPASHPRSASLVDANIHPDTGNELEVKDRGEGEAMASEEDDGNGMGLTAEAQHLPSDDHEEKIDGSNPSEGSIDPDATSEVSEEEREVIDVDAVQQGARRSQRLGGRHR